MLRLIDRHNADNHTELLRSMHRDRKRLFVDIFDWDLAHENGEERDGFDDGDAEYLLLSDEADRHVASLRLLRTDRAHLLDSLFPELCKNAIPRGERVREITRLCLPLRQRERVEARNILARGIIDYAASAGVTSYTAVCHIAFMTDLLSAGWRCTLLGMPATIDDAMAGAVQIHMDDDTPSLLDRKWQCEPAAPRLSLSGSRLAA
ncbi:autoinducer synthase [Parvularcula flava]|nr:acyl-homoserine-lactone synthase [Aquisalinus luteolus]NHK27174.1 autoinducer synthase [Aquisalinus luteolus]